MTADAKIMEALARIEHKMDLILRVTTVASSIKLGGLPQVGDLTQTCPLCSQPVSYDVDINDSVVVRKCGCKTGKIALDMKAFAPPVPTAKKKEEEDNGGDQEDRRDPDRGRGNRGR